MYKDIHFKILAALCLVTVSISLGFAMADNQIVPIEITNGDQPLLTLWGAKYSDFDVAPVLLQAISEPKNALLEPSNIMEIPAEDDSNHSDVRYEVREKTIPFPSEIIYDDQNLTLGEAKTIAGQPGVTKELWRIEYTDGIQESSTCVDSVEFKAAKPQQTIIGRKEVYLDLDLTKAQALDVELTAYTGKITATGDIPTKGVIAVDPSVIPLHSKVYIPGYGMAVALDVGGAVKGNIIDLYFEDGADLRNFGRQTRTVYIISE